MICSFCGGENRAENRFCGMCGVRLERRKLERRIHQNTAIKCDSCGHVNEEGYKFCGMCGTRIERRLAERRGDPNRATSVANTRVPSPEVRYSSSYSGAAAAVMTAPPVQQRGPLPVEAPREPIRVEPAREQQRVERPREQQMTSIPGPSFLGLNSEPVSESEYLLEDESGSPTGFRSLVILLILAAIGGLIFMEWRANMNANPKPAPIEQGTPQNHATNKQPSVNAATTQTAVRQMGTGVRSAEQSVAKAAAAKPGQETDKPKQEETVNPAADKKKSDKRFAREDRDPDASDRAAAPATPLTRARPSASLVRAQQYLQGRGVPQSCSQGLRYLKAATDENDPNAAVQMAALYSSGHCVRMDKVQAYKWFASAHDMTPANRWIEKNMNQLWAQMNADERHRAAL